MHIEYVFNTMSHTSNKPEQALQWTQQAVSQHKFSHCQWQQWMHAYKPSTHKLNLKAAYNRCLKAIMWTQKRTIFITAECQATEAGLHRVFAVSDQPKANTLLTWAAHPCQEVDNIPLAYPSLPCSALWLLATVEVWLCTASPAWAFHLQGMQARVLRAALHSIGIVSKQAWPPSQHAKSIPQTHAHDTHKKLLKLACVIQWYACNLHGHSLWFWSRANARMQ